MQGKDFVEKTEQVFTRSLENKLVNEAMNKVKLREDKRQKWVKTQYIHSEYLNSVNAMLKKKQHIQEANAENLSSDPREAALEELQEINQKKRQDKINKNAVQVKEDIDHRAQLKVDQKTLN